MVLRSVYWLRPVCFQTVNLHDRMLIYLQAPYTCLLSLPVLRSNQLLVIYQ